ncbi:OmpA family protein [Salmonella enterica]|nr:OmpA family protein [Salmonella enterica]EKS5920011.1 OmpA family protein [Salmonella enterica]
MKIYAGKLLILAGVLTLFGCQQNPSHPGKDGSIKEIIWPAPARAKLGSGQGIFPTPESITLLDKGMTKDQVYLLLGRPHFDEGLFSVLEWDYLLHFRTPGYGPHGVTTCQLKIIYNSDKRVSGIYWRSVDSENIICPPILHEKEETSRYTLNADILFRLNEYQLNMSDKNSQNNLDKIISSIREGGKYSSISVYGYADRQGTHQHNMKLSALRAEYVKKYLVSKGFPEDKIFTKGMGEAVPETSCPGLINEKLTECLHPDRKVTVIVTPVINNRK